MVAHLHTSKWSNTLVRHHPHYASKVRGPRAEPSWPFRETAEKTEEAYFHLTETSCIYVYTSTRATYCCFNKFDHRAQPENPSSGGYDRITETSITQVLSWPSTSPGYPWLAPVHSPYLRCSSELAVHRRTGPTGGSVHQSHTLLRKSVTESPEIAHLEIQNPAVQHAGKQRGERERGGGRPHEPSERREASK